MSTMEERILIAVKQRQDDFKADIGTMTLKKCRKVLEEDMGLAPGGLDDHKDHIRDLIERMVVNPEPEPEAAPKAPNGPAEAEKMRRELNSTPRKEKEPGAKQPAAKEYGSKVQKLKRICKAATIGVPPSVYTRVTSEQDVIKRLKDLLSRHGLAKDSSAEDIAEVKHRLKKERDLDGIDTENILESSRSRRVPTVHSTCVVSHSDEDEELTGNENAQPGNGESYSKGGVERPEGKGDVESGSADDRRHAVQGKAEVASPAVKQATHTKAVALGRAPKRLADWSESDEE